MGSNSPEPSPPSITFFYFKSIQSIFSGLGFIWVITPRPQMDRLPDKNPKTNGKDH